MCAMEGKEMMWGAGREIQILKCHPLGSVEPLEGFKLEVTLSHLSVTRCFSGMGVGLVETGFSVPDGTAEL